MADLIQPSFGRREAKDERDKLHPMRLLLDPLHEQFFPRGIPPGTRHYFSGPILNQGPTGTCVAHGWAAKVAAAPIMQRLPMAVYDFYRKIVLLDEWDDNDYEATARDADLQSGTSTRAGAKCLVSLGMANTYLWASSAEDVRSWILGGFGGVVIGVIWKSSMMNTDSEGFIRYAGAEEGGHCVYINGWNDNVRHNGHPTPAARIQNSWSAGWGDGGRCWISMDDLEKALADDGEGVALTEVRLPKVKA